MGLHCLRGMGMLSGQATLSDHSAFLLKRGNNFFSEGTWFTGMLTGSQKLSPLAKIAGNLLA